MGKIYSAPTEVGEIPELDFRNIRESLKKQEEWVEKLRKWCEQHGEGEFRGKEVSFGVADGLARYIVAGTKPVKLIHVEIGDAYQYQYAHRLTAKDIKEEVRRAEAIAKLFPKR